MLAFVGADELAPKRKQSKRILLLLLLHLGGGRLRRARKLMIAQADELSVGKLTQS